MSLIPCFTDILLHAPEFQDESPPPAPAQEDTPQREPTGQHDELLVISAPEDPSPASTSEEPTATSTSAEPTATPSSEEPAANSPSEEPTASSPSTRLPTIPESSEPTSSSSSEEPTAISPSMGRPSPKPKDTPQWKWKEIVKKPKKKPRRAEQPTSNEHTPTSSASSSRAASAEPSAADAADESYEHLEQKQQDLIAASKAMTEATATFYTHVSRFDDPAARSAVSQREFDKLVREVKAVGAKVEDLAERKRKSDKQNASVDQKTMVSTTGELALSKWAGGEAAGKGGKKKKKDKGKGKWPAKE